MENQNKIERLVEEYSVYDMIAEAFMPSFRSANKYKALQGFKDVAMQAGNEVNKHPEAYQLYFLGKFNEKTGERTNEKTLLATATDFVKTDLMKGATKENE